MASISITEKRRVALAYDGKEDAEKLFEWSLNNIIQPATDHLILLSAVPRDVASPTSPKELPMLSTTPTKVNEALKDVENEPQGATARQRLVEMSNRLRTTRNISSEEHILWGDPKVMIPRYTKSNPVNLLIVGSRGLGVVKTVMLGSVSDRCLHECPCPVLVVRNTTI